MPKSFSKIWILVIIAVILIGGILAWQYLRTTKTITTVPTLLSTTSTSGPISIIEEECADIVPLISEHKYTYKLFNKLNKPNNRCVTFKTPGDPLIADGEIKITSYNWNSSYLPNAINFTIDSRGGYIGTYRLASGEIEGFTVPFGEIKSGVFDISWVEVANPNEEAIGSVAVNYLPILNTGYLDLSNIEKEHTAWVGEMNGEESWAEVELILNMVSKSAVETVKGFMESRFNMNKEQALIYLTENAREQFLKSDSELVLINPNFSREVGMLYPDFGILKIEAISWTDYKFIVKMWPKKTPNGLVETMIVKAIFNEYFIDSVQLSG
ncbi:MAG: hypothetical protein ISS83_01005 [Candidatus Pacebacteria bacterium]|nr:hypothetical protein [Candidatus Paceibacterota bacterium]